jgi:Skp family chaperone for outer membrane proteins
MNKVQTDMTRISIVALSAVLALASVVSAQTPPPTQAPPTQTAPPPAAPAQPEPVPFQPVAKIGFVNFNRLVDMTALGKAGLQRLQTLADQKNTERLAHEQRMQTLQQEIQTQASVLTPAVLNQKNAEMQRLQGEAQLMQQNAQTEIDLLQGTLLDDFEGKALPIIDAIRVERGLWFVLAVQDGGGLAVVAANPGLNLTGEVAKRLDALPGGAGG